MYKMPINYIGKQFRESTMYIETKSFPELWELARGIGYKGNKLEAVPFEGTINLNSYWDGGSRSYFQFIDLDTRKTLSVGQNGSPFDSASHEISELPFNVALVKHHIGRYTYCRIYFHPDQITKLLPVEAVELTENEKMCLSFTRRYKSSYGGVSNLRFYEANRHHGISLEDWNAAKESLIKKKLLNKAGAITVAGKNAVK